jgi:tripartite-type tricarboxylate transporter receptor subunit TctC
MMKLLVKAGLNVQCIPHSAACPYSSTHGSNKELVMKSLTRRTLVSLMALGGALAAFQAQAAWPEKPIRIVVPFPAGGPSDSAARAIAPSLAAALKQPVVVDNQPGAGGAIAAQTVQRSPADGYTLLWTAASMGVLPHIQAKPVFRSLADFVPISSVVSFSFGLFVHPSVPAKNVAELVALAKASPGKLTYATGAPSEHLTTAQFLHATQTDMLRVPYKGGVQAMPDLLAGRVQVFFTPIPLGLPHVRSGKLRLLATLQPQRLALTPDVPTLEQEGVKGVLVPTWQGLLAPAGTPRAVVEQMAQAVASTMIQPQIKALFAEQATLVDVRGLADFERTIKQDEALWKRFAQENDLPKE